MRKGITVEVGNTYKRRDGLEAFVYFKNPRTQDYDCVIVGQNAIFFNVDENGFYFGKIDKESQNDLVAVIQD